MQDSIARLIKFIRDQGKYYNPISIQLAVVINPLPNLVIHTGDLQITKDNIYISDSISKLINGDTVAVIPSLDNQTWIVISKVVKL